MNFPNYMNSNFPYFGDGQMMPMQVVNVEPYVVAALMSLIGTKLIVETVRGSIVGHLIDVKPDHIVLGENYDASKFFIRIAEIVHIMPDSSPENNYPRKRY